jgi:hypothetical protein
MLCYVKDNAELRTGPTKHVERENEMPIRHKAKRQDGVPYLHREDNPKRSEGLRKYF